MKRTPTLAIPVFAAAATLALAGCAASGEASDGSYRIGMVNPTTGAVAWAGVPIQKGAETAIEEINSSDFLGEGQTLALAPSDSQADPAKAISQYRGLVADGALAVVCCTVSSTAGSFEELSAKAKVPTVVNGATLPGLAAPPYLYRTVVLPDADGGMYDQLVDAVAAELAPESAVIVTTSDMDGQVNARDDWTAALKRNEISILENIDTFSDDTDFSVPAASVIALNPDLLVANMQGPNTAQLVRALRQRGFEGEVVSSYGVAPSSVFEVGGAALDGTIFPIPFSALGQSERTRSFVTKYKEMHGEEPDLYSAQGYNAVWFIAEAIKAADGEVTRESVARAMADMKKFEAASGNSYEMVNGQAMLVDDAVLLEWNADGTQSIWPAG